MDAGVIDVWMQHPEVAALAARDARLASPVDACRDADRALPIALTIGVMDEAGVDIGLTAAWYGPAGDLISNDEVAKYVQQYPDRLRGVAGADLRKPMEDGERATKESTSSVSSASHFLPRSMAW